ncbi:FecR family protein [Candidatus Venteria ishoeyi]|uniref:FecR protein n=1 Tax=Candidatus Venteria ishoeyi TaxID=1899563 RepID=A0A1H6F744_9GAMM|nr:FecR domain-containing protein [Candidatus Venteria ishoeyi]SEH04864.1 FecR protein [Candidatus Venteria ishoeyi]
MFKLKFIFIFLLSEIYFSLQTGNALADSSVIKVIEMQGKVSVYKQKRSYTLTKDTILSIGDQIRTGSKSRVVLKLPDSSTVRLGEYAIFIIDSQKTGKQAFRSSFRVKSGAFRFISIGSKNRNIKIKVGKSMALGIRGTDIWGAAARNNKDIICLLDGEINVQINEQKFILNKAGEYLSLPKGQKVTTIQKADTHLLEQWIRDTATIAEVKASHPTAKSNILKDTNR